MDSINKSRSESRLDDAKTVMRSISGHLSEISEKKDRKVIHIPSVQENSQLCTSRLNNDLHDVEQVPRMLQQLEQSRSQSQMSWSKELNKNRRNLVSRANFIENQDVFLGPKKSQTKSTLGFEKADFKKQLKQLQNDSKILRNMAKPKVKRELAHVSNQNFKINVDNSFNTTQTTKRALDDRYRIPLKKQQSKAVKKSQNWLTESSKYTETWQLTKSLFGTETHRQISDIISLENGQALKNMISDPVNRMPYQVMLTADTSKKSELINYSQKFKKKTMYEKDIQEKQQKEGRNYEKLLQMSSSLDQIDSNLRKIEREKRLANISAMSDISMHSKQGQKKMEFRDFESEREQNVNMPVIEKRVMPSQTQSMMDLNIRSYNQKSRNSSQFATSRNLSSTLPVIASKAPSAFPLTYKTNYDNTLIQSQEAIEEFSKSLDRITDPSREKDSGFYVDKHKLKNIKQTLNQYKIEHEARALQCDEVLNQLTQNMKHRFLFTGGLKSKKMTEKIILSQTRKNNKQQKGHCTVMSSRVPTDYDMIHCKKYDHYTDHKGNYITKTGHLIDDYLVSDPAENNDQAKMIINKFVDQIKIKAFKLAHRCSEHKGPPNLENQNVKKRNAQRMTRKDSKNLLQKFNQSIYIKDDEKESSSSSSKSLYKSESIIRSEIPTNEFQIIEGSQYYTSDEEQKDNRLSTKLARMARETPAPRVQKEVDETFDFYENAKEASISEIFDRLNMNSERVKVKRRLTIDESFKLNSQLNFEINELLVVIPIQDYKLSQILHETLVMPGLKQLQLFHLHNCEVGSETLKVLKQIFEQHKFIQDFEIKQCKISNNNNEKLCNLFTKFKDFDKSPENKQVSINMPHQIFLPESSSSMKKLKLPTTKAKSIIQHELETAKNRQLDYLAPLKRLTLSGIKLSSQSLSLLPLIEQSEFLIKLDLSFNQFKSNQIEQILESVLNCKHLRFFNISHNNLSTEKCSLILKELVEQSWNLTVLDISFTQVESPLEIVKAAQNSLSLQSLHMDGLLIDDFAKNLARGIFGIKRNQIFNVGIEQTRQSHTFRKSIFLQRSPNKSPQGKIVNNKRITLKKVMMNVNDRVIFQRYLGHTEIQIFEFLSNKFCLWNQMYEKIIAKLVDNNIWPSWVEKDICHVNDMQRYCVVLFYNENKGNNVLNVRVKYENKEYFMIPVDFFRKIIGINCLQCGGNWLKYFHDYFEKHQPFYVYNQDSNAKLSDVKNWYVYVNFFTANQTTSLEIEVEQEVDDSFSYASDQSEQFNYKSVSLVFYPSFLNKSHVFPVVLDFKSQNYQVENTIQKQATLYQRTENSQIDYCSSDSSESLDFVVQNKELDLIGHYPQLEIRKLLENAPKHSRHILHEVKLDTYEINLINCFKKDNSHSQLRMFRQYDKYKYQDRLNSNFASDKENLSRMAKVVCESFYYLQLQTNYAEKSWPGIKKSRLKTFILDQLQVQTSEKNLDELITLLIEYNIIEKDSRKFQPTIYGNPEEYDNIIHRHHYLDLLVLLALEYQEDDETLGFQDRLNNFFIDHFRTRFKNIHIPTSRGVIDETLNMFEYRNKFILTPENDCLFNTHLDNRPQIYNNFINDLFYKLTIDKSKQNVCLMSLVSWVQNTFKDRQIPEESIFQCFIRSKSVSENQQAITSDQFHVRKIESQHGLGFYSPSFPENLLSLSEFKEFLIRISKHVIFLDESLLTSFPLRTDVYVLHQFFRLLVQQTN